jgi:hypothetical protein
MVAFALSRSLISSLLFLFLLGFFQVIYTTSANAMLGVGAVLNAAWSCCFEFDKAIKR